MEALESGGYYGEFVARILTDAAPGEKWARRAPGSELAYPLSSRNGEDAAVGFRLYVRDPVAISVRRPAVDRLLLCMGTADPCSGEPRSYLYGVNPCGLVPLYNGRPARIAERFVRNGEEVAAWTV